jgi:hypothetical protein
MNKKRLTITTCAQAVKKHRARGISFDGESDHKEKRAKDDQSNERHKYIQSPFCESI